MFNLTPEMEHQLHQFTENAFNMIAQAKTAQPGLHLDNTMYAKSLAGNPQNPTDFNTIKGTVLLRGKLAFSQLHRKYTQEEAVAARQRRQPNADITHVRPHVSITLSNIMLLGAVQNGTFDMLPLIEKVALGTAYRTKDTGELRIELTSTAPTLPAIYCKAEDNTYRQVKLERGLAANQDVVVEVYVYKNSYNKISVTFNRVYLNTLEPAYYQGSQAQQATQTLLQQYGIVRSGEEVQYSDEPVQTPSPLDNVNQQTMQPGMNQQVNTNPYGQQSVEPHVAQPNMNQQVFQQPGQPPVNQQVDPYTGSFIPPVNQAQTTPPEQPPVNMPVQDGFQNRNY